MIPVTAATYCLFPVVTIVSSEFGVRHTFSLLYSRSLLGIIIAVIVVTERTVGSRHAAIKTATAILPKVVHEDETNYLSGERPKPNPQNVVQYLYPHAMMVLPQFHYCKGKQCQQGQFLDSNAITSIWAASERSNTT